MDGGQPALPEKLLPPYGPAKGMIEGLQLLQRSSPSRVDEALLRTNGIAPHNEYKVVGALRFLDLIDEHGVPTAKSRLLKTRGAAFKLHLQDIVRAAYEDLFASVPSVDATKERIYNYFVAEVGLAGEMATKATRFFLELCQLAEINLGTPAKPAAVKVESKPRTATMPSPPPPQETRGRGPAQIPRAVVPRPSGRNLPFVFAITPELAAMDEEELYDLFAKLMNAWRRAAEEL